jgi:hypothetical protein
MPAEPLPIMATFFLGTGFERGAMVASRSEHAVGYKGMLGISKHNRNATADFSALELFATTRGIAEVQLFTA